MGIGSFKGGFGGFDGPDRGFDGFSLWFVLLELGGFVGIFCISAWLWAFTTVVGNSGNAVLVRARFVICGVSINPD